MEYVVGEILACLVVVGLITGAIGWMLNSALGQGRSKAMEASIEGLEGDLDATRKEHSDAQVALEKSAQKLQASEAKLHVSGEQLAEARSKHETETGKLKERVAVLEPLESALADRGMELDGWKRRFDGVVHEKDLALAGLMAQLGELRTLPAELTAYKSRLAAMGASLAAETAQKDSLTAQLTSYEAELADHKATLEAMQSHLQATVAEKDAAIAELRTRIGEMQTLVEQRYEQIKADDQAPWQLLFAGKDEAIAEHQSKVAELQALLDQRDEQLKSFDQRMRGAAAEKDTVIGKLRSLVSQIEPLRAELQQRDRAIEELQKRVQIKAPGPQNAVDEAQRQIHAMLAASQSFPGAASLRRSRPARWPTGVRSIVPRSKSA